MKMPVKHVDHREDHLFPLFWRCLPKQVKLQFTSMSAKIHGVYIFKNYIKDIRFYLSKCKLYWHA